LTAPDPHAHDDLQARIWADERMPPGTREAALAIAWVMHHPPTPGAVFDWTRLRMMLGHDGMLTRGGHGWRLHGLIAGDAPRYDPGNWHGYGGECEGPRLRPYKPRHPAWEDRCTVSAHHPHVGNCRYAKAADIGGTPPERDGRICGAHATITVTEHDMVTGWESVRWFCSRHSGRAAEVRAMLAARGTAPEPIPNQGGCLPRYFAADWPAIYARHCERSWTRMTGWKVPYYGVNADEWPVPGKTVIPKRPRLSLVESA
jgi:hypothetical protein